MLCFITDVVIWNYGILLLPNAIKDVPRIVHEVYLRGGSSVFLITFGIGITFGVVASLNATPESIKAASDSVIPSDVRLGTNVFRLVLMESEIFKNVVDRNRSF